MDGKLEIILRASAQVAKIRDIKDILIILTDVTREILEADRCSIFLHDKEKKQLWTIVAHGVPEIRISEDAGIAGFAFKTAETLNIPDAYKDVRFDQKVDRQTGYRTRSILAHPLQNHDGEILGVFQVINKKSESGFHVEDLDILQHLSLFVSSNLENALLQNRLKRSSEEVVFRLSHATKFKDPETQNHIVRVGLYGEEMACHLGWKEEERERIRLAAPMHDIGKVGVPDSVLQKPGKLDAQEWEIMKRHSEFGHNILRGSDTLLLQAAAEVALDHHEKWNGTGYPAGKKGEKISIYGRITALADVFDALTSKRCYKEVWSYEKTKDFIMEQKGIHFDPHLSEIFLTQWEAMKAIREKYRDDE